MYHSPFAVAHIISSVLNPVDLFREVLAIATGFFIHFLIVDSSAVIFVCSFLILAVEQVSIMLTTIRRVEVIIPIIAVFFSSFIFSPPYNQ